MAAGSAMLHSSAARRLIGRYHVANQPRATAAQALLGQLTRRVRDVLALLAHVSRILTTFDVNNRVQAALLARDAGLTS